MRKLIEYIKTRWNRHFATNPSEKYPAQDDDQRIYREEFGGIVDKYLIDLESHRDEDHPTAYHRIVYIDAENDIDWQIDGEDLSNDIARLRQVALSKLDIAHALPVDNLTENEVFTYKKLLGSGYKLALTNNFEHVENAISEAKHYRDDRNKERSRWLLLTAATVYLVVIALMYLLFTHCMNEHPHFELFTGIVMGAVGSYVSIWSRYGKMDMTGLGTKWLHYLEAMARMVIGAIFAFVILCALKSGLVFTELNNSDHILCLYIVLGFIAGFSEKFVPSIMESFIHNPKE